MAAPLQDRTIVHLDLDSFYVSVERLLDPHLNGKPIIIGGDSDRGVVASCSYEARAFGVESAMSVKRAKALCPQAIIVPVHMEMYTHYSRKVTRVIAEKAPVVEKASIDEHYLDLSGMETFFDTHRWIHDLRELIIQETGLPISFGLSVNKTVAKIATGQAKPNGERYVPAGEVKNFLDPLPIGKIPMLGEKSAALLHSIGIATIRDLRMHPEEHIEKLLGKSGLHFWQKANGIDHSPVVPYSERRSVSSEQTFESDISDTDELISVMIAMIEELTFCLRKEKRMAACITVKLRYSSFETSTRQKTIPYTTDDQVLIAEAKALFRQLYDGIPVRLIGIRLSHLVSGGWQGTLFEDADGKEQLYEAMDMIRKRFGTGKIKRATGL